MRGGGVFLVCADGFHQRPSHVSNQSYLLQHCPPFRLQSLELPSHISPVKATILFLFFPMPVKHTLEVSHSDTGRAIALRKTKYKYVSNKKERPLLLIVGFAGEKFVIFFL